MVSVLVVEDAPTVADVVRRYLEHAGLEVHTADDGHAALTVAARTVPDLVVLDIMLPGLDGIEVCRRLRAERDVPIIMLTAMDSEVDRVLGLEVGADDYLTKPFSPRELVLRVQSVLRRCGPAPRAVVAAVPSTAVPAGADPAGADPAGTVPATAVRLRDDDLELDVTAHRATLAGRPLVLTVREFDLLAHLLAHPGVAFSREQLLTAVWGWEYGDLSTVTVHVRRLRSKVEADPGRPARLSTVWGVGYRWDGAR